jgi:hypothetical protein
MEAIRCLSNRDRYQFERTASGNRTGTRPPTSARHRYPVLLVIPTCRHALTVPIPDCSNCQYLASTSSCRFPPRRPTGTPSPKSSSVATSTRTQVPLGAQFSRAVDTRNENRAGSGCSTMGTRHRPPDVTQQALALPPPTKTETTASAVLTEEAATTTATSAAPGDAAPAKTSLRIPRENP